MGNYYCKGVIYSTSSGWFTELLDDSRCGCTTALAAAVYVHRHNVCGVEPVWVPNILPSSSFCDGYLEGFH